MRQITLTRGQSAIIDDLDYERLSEFKWFCRWSPSGGHFYAIRNCRIGTKRIQLYMHRVILNASDGFVVDHVDGNTLNNVRANLRLCTHKENCWNQKKRGNNVSGFKGVHFCNRQKKWVAKIVFDGRRVHVGSYETNIEAARAYDVAASERFGRFARLNSPDSTSGALA